MFGFLTEPRFRSNKMSSKNACLIVDKDPIDGPPLRETCENNTLIFHDSEGVPERDRTCLSMTVTPFFALVSDCGRAGSSRTPLRMEESFFSQDPDKIGSAKYHFIVAIESCIDFVNISFSRNGSERLTTTVTPSGYGQSGVLASTVHGRTCLPWQSPQPAGHLYWEVSDPQVYEILKSPLRGFYPPS